jgi:hypothetical protein
LLSGVCLFLASLSKKRDVNKEHESAWREGQSVNGAEELHSITTVLPANVVRRLELVACERSTSVAEEAARMIEHSMHTDYRERTKEEIERESKEQSQSVVEPGAKLFRISGLEWENQIDSKWSNSRFWKSREVRMSA